MSHLQHVVSYINNNRKRVYLSDREGTTTENWSAALIFQDKRKAHGLCRKFFRLGCQVQTYTLILKA